MSEYKGIARWSEDAVGMISWDDTAKEGTAQVTDEKTGEVYQIGGGGGDDLIELEYTVENNRAYLTKTPAELYELIQAGKNFKIVVNSDFATYLFNEGDVLISTIYNYNIETSTLMELTFYLSPFPSNMHIIYDVYFGNENGTMSAPIVD